MAFAFLVRLIRYEDGTIDWVMIEDEMFGFHSPGGAGARLAGSGSGLPMLTAQIETRIADRLPRPEACLPEHDDG
ncbi:hypothetical protein [Paenirhodobacter sp.]|uniref:hypothetical protein n=1 Tax=Paenirhodobacter sp. TaxID=1965326 RepID=UPI003B3FC6ED